MKIIKITIRTLILLIIPLWIAFYELKLELEEKEQDKNKKG